MKEEYDILNKKYEEISNLNLEFGEKLTSINGDVLKIYLENINWKKNE